MTAFAGRQVVPAEIPLQIDPQGARQMTSLVRRAAIATVEIPTDIDEDCVIGQRIGRNDRSNHDWIHLSIHDCIMAAG